VKKNEIDSFKGVQGKSLVRATKKGGEVKAKEKKKRSVLASERRERSVEMKKAADTMNAGLNKGRKGFSLFLGLSKEETVPPILLLANNRSRGGGWKSVIENYSPSQNNGENKHAWSGRGGNQENSPFNLCIKKMPTRRPSKRARCRVCPRKDRGWEMRPEKDKTVGEKLHNRRGPQVC